MECPIRIEVLVWACVGCVVVTAILNNLIIFVCCRRRCFRYRDEKKKPTDVDPEKASNDRISSTSAGLYCMVDMAADTGVYQKAGELREEISMDGPNRKPSTKRPERTSVVIAKAISEEAQKKADIRAAKLSQKEEDNSSVDVGTEPEYAEAMMVTIPEGSEVKGRARNPSIKECRSSSKDTDQGNYAEIGEAESDDDTESIDNPVYESVEMGNKERNDETPSRDREMHERQRSCLPTGEVSDAKEDESLNMKAQEVRDIHGGGSTGQIGLIHLAADVSSTRSSVSVGDQVTTVVENELYGLLSSPDCKIRHPSGTDIENDAENRSPLTTSSDPSVVPQGDLTVGSEQVMHLKSAEHESPSASSLGRSGDLVECDKELKKASSQSVSGSGESQVKILEPEEPTFSNLDEPCQTTMQQRVLNSNYKDSDDPYVNCTIAGQGNEDVLRNGNLDNTTRLDKESIVDSDSNSCCDVRAEVSAMNNFEAADQEHDSTVSGPHSPVNGGSTFRASYSLNVEKGDGEICEHYRADEVIDKAPNEGSFDKTHSFHETIQTPEPDHCDEQSGLKKPMPAPRKLILTNSIEVSDKEITEF